MSYEIRRRTFLKVYKKWLELYSIVLNDSRLWGRVENVEEIFDIYYICIVNISNEISKLWPEANKNGYLQRGVEFRMTVACKCKS